MFRSARIALGAAVLISAGVVGVYLISDAGAGGDDAGAPKPQVEGRLVTIISGEGLGDGEMANMSVTGICEFDARLLVEDGRVVSLEDVREGIDVEPGDAIAYPDYASDPGRPAPVGPAELDVYQDEEGNLRAGCAPESRVRLTDGREMTLREYQELAGVTPP